MALPPASLISFRQILKQVKWLKLGDWDSAIAPSSPISFEHRYSFSILDNVCEAAIALAPLISYSRAIHVERGKGR